MCNDGSVRPGRFIAMLAMLVAGAAGCRAKAGEDCTRTACADGLSCHESVCRPKDEVDRIRADQERAKTCRATCTEDGLCGAKNGRCVATTDEDCRKSRVCRQKGACSMHDDVCAVVSDEDCKRSVLCTQGGKCSSSEGKCKFAAGACRERPECKERGQCVEDGEVCSVGSDQDCEASRRCRQEAECTLRDGDCVLADDDDCARSHWCWEYANCKRGPGPGGCFRDAPFARSEACRRYGCCGKGEGQRCRARSDDECKKSELCAGKTRCWNENGVCKGE